MLKVANFTLSLYMFLRRETEEAKEKIASLPDNFYVKLFTS